MLHLSIDFVFSLGNQFVINDPGIQGTLLQWKAERNWKLEFFAIENLWEIVSSFLFFLRRISYLEYPLEGHLRRCKVRDFVEIEVLEYVLPEGERVKGAKGRVIKERDSQN